jgi:hypothetical protein
MVCHLHVLAALPPVPIELADWLAPTAPSRRIGEDENLFSLSGVEPKFLGRLARSLVAILTKMFGLPLCNQMLIKIRRKDGAWPALPKSVLNLLNIMYHPIFLLCCLYVPFCVFCVLCVNVYCTTAVGCRPSCSYIYIYIHHHTGM